MKIYRNLFESITSFENLWLASKKAQRGKRFKDSALRFNAELEKNLLQLKQELEEQTYHCGCYRQFYVQKSKKRLISAAPYRDRVVHHALCNIIEPIFDRTFIYDSYACRQGKGTHKAVERFSSFLRNPENNYVLKCDIRRYFPSIDHRILLQAIKRKIACPKTLDLIDIIIESGRSLNEPKDEVLYFSGDELFTPIDRAKGIPIGNLTSQFFANVYLDRFDHWMKETMGFLF
jgi:retron-type reverse transcriptase